MAENRELTLPQGPRVPLPADDTLLATVLIVGALAAVSAFALKLVNETTRESV